MFDASTAFLNFSWILPNLAMGGALSVEAAERIAREHGIRHIVDLRLEDKDDEEELRRHGMTLLHLPTADLCAVSPEMLDHGVAWVSRHLRRGDKVFIHCQYGIGRSALLVCCVLVSLGHTPSGALRLAKDSRPCVGPTPEQLDTLLAWSRRFRARAGEEPPPDTSEDLARIAYSFPE